MLALLAARRSAYAPEMGEPGPSEAELEKLLEIALRAPDHGKLEPWRVLVIRGEARAAMGALLAEITLVDNPKASAELVAQERGRFVRAPVVVAVISSPRPLPKIPQWEQILSAGAVCENLLIAAEAMGYRGQWITEWYAYDARVGAALGLDAAAGERVAGFVYLGTSTKPNPERRRPVLADKVREWRGPVGGG